MRAAPELARLRERMAHIGASIPAPGVKFDAAALGAELEELLRAARALTPDAAPEIRQLLILSGRLRFSQGELARGRDLLTEGLAMQVEGTTDANQLTRDHYLLAAIASDLRNYQGAAEHYGKAAEFAKAASEFDENRRLGIRERLAYALHEAKRYAEALAANMDLLTQAEQLFGPDDHRLSTVLVNTAQNLYALRRLADAESYLRRALAIAESRADIERQHDFLYQLAVLAGEQGRAAEARSILVERVERLETRGTAKLAEAARRSLQQFDVNQLRARGTIR